MRIINNGFAFAAACCTLFLLSSCARAPIAGFAVKNEKRVAPAKVAFDNKSQRAKQYEWDFGDGTKSSDPFPVHEYRTSGHYTVTLKAISGKKTTSNVQHITIEAPVECLVEIETDYGIMTVQLSNATPKHRDNFIKLVEEGYFNDLLFHRVINGFMIQGGDPNSRNAPPALQLGMGGPGYQVPAEFVDTLIHVKGALAAARTGDAVNPKKESSGSQFYIVQGRPLTDSQLDGIEAQKNFHYTPDQRKAYKELGGTPFLDRDYTVFGHVVKGLEVIDKIAAVQTARGDRPLQDVKMKMRVVK